MNKLLRISVIVLSLTLMNCSKENGSNSGNAFYVNGVKYNTAYAYTSIGSNGPNRVWIFSSADRYQDTYVETRGRFDFRLYDDVLQPGTYKTTTGGIGDTIEFTEGIEYNNGELISQGDDLAFATSGTSSFNSGTVTVHSVTLGSDGLATSISLEYRFEWDNITVTGSYEGDVRLDN